MFPFLEASGTSKPPHHLSSPPGYFSCCSFSLSAARPDHMLCWLLLLLRLNKYRLHPQHAKCPATLTAPRPPLLNRFPTPAPSIHPSQPPAPSPPNSFNCLDVAFVIGLRIRKNTREFPRRPQRSKNLSISFTNLPQEKTQKPQRQGRAPHFCKQE